MNDELRLRRNGLVESSSRSRDLDPRLREDDGLPGLSDGIDAWLPFIFQYQFSILSDVRPSFEKPLPMTTLSPSDNLKETAVFYTVAMSLGLVTVDEVVAWCDEVIIAHPDPPLAIIRASVVRGKKQHEVGNELDLLEGEFDEGTVYRRLFGKMVEIAAADRSRCWDMIVRLHEWDFPCDEVSQELIKGFYYEQYSLNDENYSCEEYRRLADERLTDEFLDFLQKASQGEVKVYDPQEYGWEYQPTEPKNMRNKIPGLIYEALIVGWLTSIAILLMRSQEQAGSGIGWGEVVLVLIIVALYVGINKWRKRK